MRINNNNNVNFTARMNLTSFDGPTEARWNNIAKIFNEITPKNDNYILELEDTGRGYIAGDFTCKGFSALCGFHFSDDVLQKMMKLSDSEIAEKFSKLLDIFKHCDNIYQTVFNFLEKTDKYRTLEKASRQNVVDGQARRHYYRISAPLLDKLEADFSAAVKKDKILREFSVTV